jgi:hypothetical protein
MLLLATSVRVPSSLVMLCACLRVSLLRLFVSRGCARSRSFTLFSLQWLAVLLPAYVFGIIRDASGYFGASFSFTYTVAVPFPALVVSSFF